jgi:hypothetical protein
MIASALAAVGDFDVRNAHRHPPAYAPARIEPPPTDQRLRFLEGLLLAELRRRDRQLV